MKELYEIRLSPEIAKQYFDSSVIQPISEGIVKVKIGTDDLRARVFFEKDSFANNKNKVLFSHYKIIRNYSKSELSSASLFRIQIRRIFEPPGEACGTEYDYSGQCTECKTGFKQIGPLRLIRGKIPKTDISKTIAGEVVVSEQFATICSDNKLSGVKFSRVYDRDKTIKYYQFIIASPKLTIHEKTIAGVSPYNFSTKSDKELELKLPDGRIIGRMGPEVYACTKGHTIGLNLLSEVYVNRNAAIHENDFFETEQKVGVSRGYLRPESIILCSQRARQVILDNKLKGFDFEVAYTVSD